MACSAMVPQPDSIMPVSPSATIIPLQKQAGTQEAQPRASGIALLQSLVDDDLQAVNTRILSYAESHVELIPTIAEHLVSSGGKRLRPMLTLASARLCGYQGHHHVDLATCVEFIHTATLLHDDVVDESRLRRGLATANHIWGNKASVLVGDYLFAQSFTLMVQTGSLDVLRILSHAASVIAEGEVMQLATSNDTATQESTYLEVISAKTAELFAAACEVGAVIAETPDYCHPLREYGRLLGIAFQMVDDALDYAADTKILGKTVGDDFREGKVTLPVILACARGTDDERAYLHTLFLEDTIRDEQAFTRTQGIMKRYDAIAASMEKARDYASKAQAHLQSLPDGDEKEAMHATAQFCIERTF